MKVTKLRHHSRHRKNRALFRRMKQSWGSCRVTRGEKISRSSIWAAYCEEYGR